VDRLRNFLGGKEGRLSAEAFDLVDWDANEDALKDFAPMFWLLVGDETHQWTLWGGSTHETQGRMGYQQMPML